MTKFEPVREDFEEIKPMGFVPPEYDEKDFVVGAERTLGDTEIVRPDGQYLDTQIERELQRKYGTETMGCPQFGTDNSVEITAKAKYPNEPEMNNSDRCLCIEANNTKNGNNPKNAADALYNFGVCEEKELPFDETCTTWEKFHSPKPLTEKLKALAKKWLGKWEFGYEWLWTGGGYTSLGQKLAYLKKYLPMGAIGISVVAWKMRNGKYYKENGEQDNHWVSLIGYEEGECWYIFDSYDSYIKKLEWNYDFGFAMRYSIKKKLNEANPVLPVEDNNMKFYKNIDGSAPRYQLGKDGKYHRFYDENTFKRLNGEFSENVIEAVVITPDQVGDPIFVGSSILNALINFFANLKGKKGNKNVGSESKFLSINSEDLKRVANGCINVVLASLITFLLNTIPSIDFGQATYIVVAGFTYLLGLAQKWLTNSDGQFLKGEAQ